MKIAGLLISKIKKMYGTGAVHITLGTFLTKFVAFFGSIVVVKILSKEEYGVMGYAENIYSYAYIFAALGMSNAILRYLVIAKDASEKKRYFNYIVKRSIIINLIIAIILAVVSQIMPISNKYLAARSLIPILSLLLPFQDLLNDSLYSIRSFFRNKLYAYGAFLSSLALIVGRIVGAKLAGVEGVFWSRVIINAVFALFGFFYVKEALFQTDNVGILDKGAKRTVNLYSIQYMITNGLWAIFLLNDKFLLGLLLDDPAGLADYNVASVLPGNIAIFATAIGTFVGPYFTKNEKDLEWVRRKFRSVMVISAGTVALVALFISIAARPLIGLMYGEQYLNVVLLMRVLLLGAFFNSGLRFTIANILAAMGELKYNMLISAVGIAIQIILDYFFVPNMGVIGVALSNCIVFLLMSIALFIIFYRMLGRRNSA